MIKEENKKAMTKERLKEIIASLVGELDELYDHFLEMDDLGDFIKTIMTKEEAKELDLDGWFGEE